MWKDYMKKKQSEAAAPTTGMYRAPLFSLPHSRDTNYTLSLDQHLPLF